MCLPFLASVCELKTICHMESNHIKMFFLHFLTIKSVYDIYIYIYSHSHANKKYIAICCLCYVCIPQAHLSKRSTARAFLLSLPRIGIRRIRSQAANAVGTFRRSKENITPNHYMFIDCYLDLVFSNGLLHIQQPCP